MHIILSHISPWECSPYLLRRVCRAFRGFYASRSLWLELWSLHLSGPAQPEEMSMEEARRHCSLALRQPWEHLIRGETLEAFRQSGWTTLSLGDSGMQSLPEQLGELTSLRGLSLAGCHSLKALPPGACPASTFEPPGASIPPFF